MNTRKPSIAALVLAVCLSGTAHAALQGRDLNGSIDSFEAYYDTDLNITWLADANINGGMNWISANTWAAEVSFSDGVNNITYADWRLPTALNQDGTGPCSGFNCTGSEMGHMFYVEFGNVANQNLGTIQTSWVDGYRWYDNSSLYPNYKLFSNLISTRYWSETETAPSSSSGWVFDMNGGRQLNNYSGTEPYAWAVSDGDVGISAIPEASTYAMMFAGLALVGVAARRRKQ